MAERREKLEALHERDFMATFDFDAYHDKRNRNEETDESDDENDDGLTQLSQSMSQLSSQ